MHVVRGAERECNAHLVEVNPVVAVQPHCHASEIADVAVDHLDVEVGPCRNATGRQDLVRRPSGAGDCDVDWIAGLGVVLEGGGQRDNGLRLTTARNQAI